MKTSIQSATEGAEQVFAKVLDDQGTFLILDDEVRTQRHD